MMLLVPAGRVVVARVAVPVADVGYGTFKVAVPTGVLEPLLKKLTLPTLVDGETVAVKVTFAPEKTFVLGVVIVTELPTREVGHAVKSASALTEPRPVT
jgi:hypothetical protein